MKAFKFLLLSAASLFIFSCSQLNLKNGAGSVSVSLPGSAERKIVAETETAASFENLSYRIFIVNSSGKQIAVKEALPGSAVEFTEIEEGTYTVAGLCLSAGEAVAAGTSNTTVVAGETAQVALTLHYNRLSDLDEENSCLVYDGPKKFTVSEWKSFNPLSSGNLFVQLVFKNGWSEEISDGITLSGNEKPVAEDDEKYTYSVTASWSSGEIKFEDTLVLYVYTASESISGEDNPEVDLAKSAIVCSIDSGTTYSSVEALKSALASAITVNLAYSDGKTESVKTGITITPVSGEAVDGKTTYSVVVVWTNGIYKLTKNYTFCVTSEGGSGGSGGSGIAGLSEDNPCTTFEEFKTAIANVNENGTIYLEGDENNVITMTEQPTIIKSCIVASTVSNLTIKRMSNANSIYISSGVQLQIGGNDSKKITFADDSSIESVASNGFFFGEGNLFATFVEFSGIKSNAVQVGNATLSSCSFTNVQSTYGAVYIASGYSAEVNACSFSGNTSTNTNAGSCGDIYFVKSSSGTLTLSGAASSDIGIYVDNSSVNNPEIVLSDLDLGSYKLNIKVNTIDTSLALFKKLTENVETAFNATTEMDGKFTFMTNSDSESHSPDIDGDGTYMTSLDGDKTEYWIVEE